MRILAVILWSLSLAFVSGCVSNATFEGGAIEQQSQAPLILQEQPTPLNIVVIGGTAGIGLEVVKLALDRGHTVTAVSRNTNKLRLARPNLRKQDGNILNIQDMQRLLPGHDIIISSVGLAAGKRNVTLFSRGSSNIIKVMRETGQNRFIVVSAIGAGDSQGHGGFLFDTLLQPLILGDDIDDKSRMEALISEANIDYTIVRPAILTNQPAQQKYRILQQLQGIETGSISRQDVAHFIVSIAEQNAYIKEVVTLSD